MFRGLFSGEIYSLFGIGSLALLLLLVIRAIRAAEEEGPPDPNARIGLIERLATAWWKSGGGGGT